MSGRFVAIASCALASLLLAGSIGAAGSKKPTVGFASAPKHALPGESVRVVVAVRPAGRSCTLSVTYAGGAKQSGLRAVRAAGGRAAWEFTVPDEARAGPATLRASCQRVGTVRRSLSIVGEIVPARISVEQSGFSIRPGRTSGASLSYGLILKNESPNQDAFDVTVLVNFVDDTNYAWGSKTTRVFGIPAGGRYALGDYISFSGGLAPPVTRLEAVIQIGGRAPAARRPPTLGSLPGLRNTRIFAGTDPAWVGGVDGEVVNEHAKLFLDRNRFSAVVFDWSGVIIGGGYGTSNISMPPSARSVFVLKSGFDAIPMIRAATAMISPQPSYRQPGS